MTYYSRADIKKLLEKAKNERNYCDNIVYVKIHDILLEVVFNYISDKDIDYGHHDKYTVGFFNRYDLQGVFIEGNDILPLLGVKTINRIIDGLEKARIGT